MEKKPRQGRKDGKLASCQSTLVNIPDGLEPCDFDLRNPEAPIERKYTREMKLNILYGEGDPVPESHTSRF